MEDIKKRKQELIDSSKKDLNASIDEYKQILQSAAVKQNAGALNSYNTFTPQSESQALASRSAYLNRLKNADTSQLNNAMEANRNVYQSYLDANSNALDSAIAELEYQDAVNKQNMAYQDERNRITDEQWQKDFDLTKQAYTSAARSGGYSSGGGSYSDSGTVISGQIPKAQKGQRLNNNQQSLEEVVAYAQSIAGNKVDKNTIAQLIANAKNAGADSEDILYIYRLFE